MSLDDLRRRADSLRERHRRARERVKEESVAADAAEERLKCELDAQAVVQGVAQTVQQQAHDRIAAVVSRCLAAVFEDPYTFTIRFDRKRGKTEAVIAFMRDGNEVSPTFGSGGGVLDVASFALRLACLVLTRPPLRRVLVLDEPMRHLHGDGNRERFRELVETLPKELGVQVILATGLDWLTTGKVVRL